MLRPRASQSTSSIPSSEKKKSRRRPRPVRLATLTTSQWARNCAIREIVLAQGVAYLRTTDSLYRTTMDRAAHEELGVGLEKIRAADLGRIFASPSIAKLFPKELQLPALTMFLAGIGLDLKTVAGTDIKIDDSLNPLKAPRAFVMPVDPPVDVRLSVKPQGGYRDLAVLLHEAGHAVH